MSLITSKGERFNFVLLLIGSLFLCFGFNFVFWKISSSDVLKIFSIFWIQIFTAWAGTNLLKFGSDCKKQNFFFSVALIPFLGSVILFYLKYLTGLSFVPYIIPIGIIYICNYIRNGRNVLLFVPPVRETFYLFVVFIIFLAICSFNSEILSGEKFMDVQMLHYFSRGPELFPDDPWAFGEKMRYYFMGYFHYGELLRAVRLEPSMGFWPALGLILISFVSSLLAFFEFKTPRFHWLASLGIVCFSPLAPIHRLITERSFSKIFWNSTRVYPRQGFAEYINWSFIFGDIHPHVIAYQLIPLGFLLIRSFKVKSQRRTEISVIIGLLFSLFPMFNSWDLITMSLVYGIFGFLFFSDSENRNLNTIKDYSIAPIVAIFVSAPFLSLQLGSSFQGATGLNGINGFGVKGLLLHQVHFYLFFMILYFYFQKIKKVQFNTGLSSIIFVLLLAPLANLARTPFRPLYLDYSFVGVILFLLTFSYLVFSFLNKKDESIVILLGAVALLVISENFIVMDWFNTNFKLRTTCYLFFCLFSGRYLYHLIEDFDLTINKRIVISLFSMVLLVSSGIALSSHVLGNWHRESRVELAPLGYMKRFGYIGPQKAIEWMNKNIKGTPRIVEGNGKSFDKNSNLYSTYTGLPSLIGWNNHVLLRGVTEKRIKLRSTKIYDIYEGNDPLLVYEYLRGNDVGFIIVGPYEKRKYLKEGLKKFKAYSNEFVPLFEHKGTIVFGIRGVFERYLSK